VDAHLPGSSGLELCRRLRDTPTLAGLAVALFSSWERPGDIAAGLEAGADFLLAKDLLAQPEAWRDRIGEILTSADSQPPSILVSCLQGLSPAQPMDKWFEAINQALRHSTVTRLGRDVLRVLVRRAARRGQLLPDEAAEWLLSGDLTRGRAKLGEAGSADTLQAFAFALLEQLCRLGGTAVSEPFRVALGDALARPMLAVPMKPVHAILLVEDNPADIKITQRALEGSSGAVELIVVRDGQEALDYLLRQGAFADHAGWRSPDLILLDLNLPRLTGLQLVERIRATPELKAVPIVVLTTSRRSEDVRQTYAAGANTYIAKPQDFGRFVEVLRTIQSYWLDTALLPPGSRE
jgi:CheY-like chemotaxis protein